VVSCSRYFLIACIGIFFICSGSDEELFLRANKYSEEQDWKQAFDSYNFIKKKGSLIWYNMGNCCYHLKNYTEAFIYWKRAEQGASRSLYAQSKYNQQILTQQLNKTTTMKWTEQLYEFFVYYLISFSLLFLQLLFLFCWFLFFFLYRYQKKRFFFTFLFLVLNGLMGASLLVKYKEKEKIGIVITASANVFAGPNQEYHVLSTLDHIDQVIIQDIKHDWYKIKNGNRIGWVAASAVQVV
jgi:tetratricopeptide (TPR) repeat protein